MIPQQTKIKIYIITSIIVYIISLVSIFIINMYVSNLFRSVTALTASPLAFLNRLYIFLIVMCLVSVVFGIYIFIMSFIRGINRYRDLARRIANITEQEDFNLKSIEFPKEDEFGNVGVYFNQIISKIQRFDELKTQRIKIEKQKFELLSRMIDTPILVVSIEKDDKIVKYYNESFEKIFARKEEEGEYYDIKNLYLAALKVGEPPTKNYKGVLDVFNKMSEGELIYSFIDKEFDNAINIAIADKTKTVIKKDIRTIRGDEVYRSDLIEIYPIWNDYGTTMEVVIFFNKLRKVKR